MRKTQLLFGCMLLCSSIANVEGVQAQNTDKFPSLCPAEKKVSANESSLLSLNDDKNKGTGMWATTVLDYSNGPGFVHFYSDEPSSLVKTGFIKSIEEDKLRRWTMIGGCMHNGEYLGYMFYRYDLGFNYAEAFARVDLENGTWETLRDMHDLEGNWDYMEAMASDPVTGKLVGVPRKTDGTVGSTIGEVNPADGVYTKWTDLDAYYFSIAFDINGTLWAVRWIPGADNNVAGSALVTLDPENNYTEKTVTELTMNGKPFKMYYQNSIQFDYATGELWALAASVETSEQYVCSIDTETGVMTSKGRLGYGDMAVGLYIPYYKADAADAAFRVSGISSSFDESGVVTLAWTNPTTTWDKQELTELAEVRIYRDAYEESGLVATIPAENKVGEEMTWTDEDAEQGVHTYYIVPCRRPGEKGIADTWMAFSGRDVPGMPGNVTLVKENNNLKLSWTQPELGSHDGWYDKSSITYTITRFPDNEVIAENFTGTEIIDEGIGKLQTYYYEIKTANADGEGETAISDPVMAGEAIEVPFSTDFEDEEDAGQWVAVDNNNDQVTFAYVGFPTTGFGIDTYESGTSDDYAISPSLILEGGTTYKVTYNLYFLDAPSELYPNLSHDFSFTVGQGITAEAQSTVLDTKEGFKNTEYYENIPFTVYYKPETSGEYNFGFYLHTLDLSNFVIIDSFSIEKVYNNDLSADAIEGTLNPAKGAASEYKVTVTNNSTEDIDNYKVQVVRFDGDSQIVLGETEVNETIASFEKAEIAVSVTPDIEGELQIAGVAVIEGDEKPENNISPMLTVTAAPEGTIPFNLTVKGENEGLGTRCPISFANYYSEVQSIYFAEELNQTEDVSISRLAIQYNTNSPVGDPFNVQIYLGFTDAKYVDYEKLEWISLENLTKVYDGQQTIVEGQDNMMVFELDEAFTYDHTKNLVVTFCKEGMDPNGNYYPAAFHNFNTAWPDDDSMMRTLRYENDITPEASTGSGDALPDLPILHLAVETKSGISNIVLGSSIIYSNGTISFNGIDAAHLTVFDMAGRTVFSKETAAQNSVNVNLDKGIYIVKVVDKNGNTYTRKFSAER